MVLLACPCGAAAQPAPDTTPPSFVDFEVLPQGGDITNGAVDIAVRVRLTDDGSGVAGLGYPSSPSQAVFLSPSGAQTAAAMFESHQNLASGTSLDGRYEFTMPLPQFSESGTWTLQYLLLVDQLGNMRFLSHADLVAAGYSPQFVLTGLSDTAAPMLQELTFTPDPINLASGPAELVMRVRITDDLSGVAQTGGMQPPSQIRLVSPSRYQSVDLVFDGFQLIAGDALDGTYEQHVVLLGALESGTWSVDYFLLADGLGNLRSLDAGDLADQGLPSTLVLQ